MKYDYNNVVRELGDDLLRFEMMEPWIRYSEIRDFIEEFRGSFQLIADLSEIDEGSLLKCLGTSIVISRKIAKWQRPE